MRLGKDSLSSASGLVCDLDSSYRSAYLLRVGMSHRASLGASLANGICVFWENELKPAQSKKPSSAVRTGPIEKKR